MRRSDFPEFSLVVGGEFKQAKAEQELAMSHFPGPDNLRGGFQGFVKRADFEIEDALMLAVAQNSRAAGRQIQHRSQVTLNTFHANSATRPAIGLGGSVVSWCLARAEPVHSIQIGPSVDEFHRDSQNFAFPGMFWAWAGQRLLVPIIPRKILTSVVRGEPTSRT